MHVDLERKVWVLNQSGNMERGEGVINGTITLVDHDAVPINFGGSGATAWNDITGKPATFAPTTGTTAATARPGNWVPTWSDVTGKPATYQPTYHMHTSNEITDMTATGRDVITAANASAARAAIGAGTSSLVLGTNAGTAKDGAYQPAWSAVTGKPALLTKAAAAPASATAAGTADQYFYADDTFYLCVAANTWRKVPLEAW